MDLIILFIVLYVILLKINSRPEDKVVIRTKQCPPHQWFWQEIVDENGTKHGERIVCKVCGPLSNSLNGGSGEEL